MRIYICILLTGLFLWSCGGEERKLPPNSLSKKKFTEVMIDVQLSEGMKNQRGMRERNLGVNAPEIYHALFEKHGITKESFLVTYNYYRAHPGEMELIYEAVLDSLNILDAEIKQSFSAAQRAERDSIQAANRKILDDMKLPGVRQ